MVGRVITVNNTVIIPTKQYESKITEFIEARDFHSTTKEPTSSFQSLIRKTINNSKTLIPPETKWEHINMNPSAPSLKGLIKLHKPEHPIRPVVNWQRAPAYNLARLFTQKIRLLAPLPSRYNLPTISHIGSGFSWLSSALRPDTGK